MRRDVLELRQFYASDLGRAARAMIGRKVIEVWGDARGLDVLALGYATPFVTEARRAARRVVGAMPAQQGVEIWPAGEANLTTLTADVIKSMLSSADADGDGKVGFEDFQKLVRLIDG